MQPVARGQGALMSCNSDSAGIGLQVARVAVAKLHSGPSRLLYAKDTAALRSNSLNRIATLNTCDQSCLRSTRPQMISPDFSSRAHGHLVRLAVHCESCSQVTGIQLLQSLLTCYRESLQQFLKGERLVNRACTCLLG